MHAAQRAARDEQVMVLEEQLRGVAGLKEEGVGLNQEVMRLKEQLASLEEEVRAARGGEARLEEQVVGLNEQVIFALYFFTSDFFFVKPQMIKVNQCAEP